jgi:L-amino acid N-acyltransferase YncA
MNDEGVSIGADDGSARAEALRSDRKGENVRIRPATSDDAAVIARIYNEGIADGIATFETRPRVTEDISQWLDSRFPIVIVDEPPDGVIAFASTSEYRPRECYAGIAEFSVYVAREHRGRGAGRVAMLGLIEACQRAGFWKLVSRVFVENLASRALLRDLGFREVGIYERHARLHSVWRDVVIVERLLGEGVG